MTWKTGDVEEFFEDITKPARLIKLEGIYEDSARVVLFDNRFGGEWMVDIKGCFAGFEIKEIANALKAANRLKPL